MWLCVYSHMYLSPVFWVPCRLVYSSFPVFLLVIPGVSTLPCLPLMLSLKTIILKYFLVCVFLVSPCCVHRDRYSLHIKSLPKVKEQNFKMILSLSNSKAIEWTMPEYTATSFIQNDRIVAKNILCNYKCNIEYQHFCMLCLLCCLHMLSEISYFPLLKSWLRACRIQVLCCRKNKM